MANRRISQLPILTGSEVAEQDLLTMVHVFEVDPTLKNKKITVSGFKNYLDFYYLTATGGTLYGSLIVQNNLTVSGTVNISGNSTFSALVVQTTATVSGTISGTIITGNVGRYTTLTGTTGIFTTVSGTTITGVTGQFNSLTGNTAGFTTLTGTTVTGTTANFNVVSGTTITGTTANFVTVSGTTITGTTVNATTGVFQFLQATNQTYSGNLTFSGTTFTLGSGFFSSGISVTGTISGTTVTGTTAKFTTITGTTLSVTAASGATAALVCSGVVSGDTSGFIIKGPLIILP